MIIKLNYVEIYPKPFDGKLPQSQNYKSSQKRNPSPFMITNKNVCSKKLLGGLQRPQVPAQGPAAEPGHEVRDRHGPRGRVHT